MAEMIPTVCKQEVQASVRQVFYAFTNATALREWLCDGSSVAPHAGGRILLWWNNGNYLGGEYRLLKPNQQISLHWTGRGEAQTTEVFVQLETTQAATHVHLTQTGPGAGVDWPAALENLAAVLETGCDLRIVRRPMLGISPSDFNPEIARSLGVPVDQGIRLDGVLEGMGAHAAGLQKDDVIVEIEDHPITNFATLAAAMHNRMAGDQLKVEYYRGDKKHTTYMTLSPRPLPEVPNEPPALAQAVQKIFSDNRSALEQALENVSEDEASFIPAEGEWSIKDVLAHLILGERFNQSAIVDLIGGQERWADDWGGNVNEMNRAVTAAYSTLADLLSVLKKTELETVALVGSLPPEFVSRKGSYWRMGISLLQGSIHTSTHLEQIETNLAAARKR